VHCYLAVQGGIDVPPVLGSRSTDTLSGLGPSPLQVGDQLPFGDHTGDPAEELAALEDGDDIRVRVRFGPREDWFRSAEELTWNRYQMGMANRIGARLNGPGLTRSVVSELPSEGLMAGAVQVPGDGRPIIFLADHPTTGGYPVIAVVHPADLPLIAQARPGASVVFRGP
jgi:allophanate hydrolase subunit 2